jgi:glycosyltransferase involved in cell wall biosynthesis
MRRDPLRRISSSPLAAAGGPPTAGGGIASESSSERRKHGGVLVARGSAPALADAPIDVLGAPERRERLGRAARRRVEEDFSIGAVGRQLRDAFTAAGVKPADCSAGWCDRSP